MPRSSHRMLSCLLPLLLLAPVAGHAQVMSEEEEESRRIGFYFAVTLDRSAQLGQANGIGLIVDPPNSQGAFTPAGPEVDGDFGSRFNFGFKLGFRLRGRLGRVEGSFLQLDELKDLRTVAPGGKVIANTLASADAGFFEDIGGRVQIIPGQPFYNPGPPDGSVAGYEAGDVSEQNDGSGAADRGVIDGAEDFNRNGRADFIRFDTSDLIVGTMKVDNQTFDLDYVRRVKKLRRFSLDARAGLRFASVGQDMDLAYRQVGGFAVYTDTEGCPEPNCSDETVDPNDAEIWDGDGDGDFDFGIIEADGDGFMDGDGDGRVLDSLNHVETITEDRILAVVDTNGMGLKLGVDATYDLSKKWRLTAGMAVSFMATDSDYRYVETYTSERDRYMNFIEWDFNGDGFYDNHDLDFDGDCLEPCAPDKDDSTRVDMDGGVLALPRAGASDAVTSDLEPDGVTRPFVGEQNLMVGNAVPESERNRDILTEVRVLNDQLGSESGLTTMVDVSVGAQWYFSKFASLDFGARTNRWFGAGEFRSMANDVLAGRSIDIRSGDFANDGFFVRMTITPR